MKERIQVPISPELSQDTKEYLKEMFNLSRVHGGSLSRGGLNMGRSEMSVANYFTFDLISLLVDTESWYQDALSGPIEYIDSFKQKQIDGVISAPSKTIPEDTVELATRVRTIFYWAEQQADKKDVVGSEVPRWSYTIAEPTKIIASMLDNLVDSEEARAQWIGIKDNRNAIYAFVQKTRFEFQDRLQAAGRSSIS